MTDYRTDKETEQDALFEQFVTQTRDEIIELFKLGAQGVDVRIPDAALGQIDFQEAMDYVDQIHDEGAEDAYFAMLAADVVSLPRARREYIQQCAEVFVALHAGEIAEQRWDRRGEE